MKNILILGSTGSIGDSSLKIISKYPDLFFLIGFSYHTNFELAKKIQKKYLSKYIICTNTNISTEEKEYWKNQNIILLNTLKEIIHINYEIVITGIVGGAGVEITYQLAQQGKTILLANKESLVIAGHLIMPLAKKYNTQIIPIDSEHNSVFRLFTLFSKNLEKSLHKVYLTASGGPLRTLSIEEIKNVKKEKVLQHPNWKMGAKITVDSASLINKSLEIIEAHYLFNLDYQYLNAVIHPQSYAHTIIEHMDGTYFIHASIPDMVYPICYALFYPEEPPNPLDNRINQFPNLIFEEIDHKKFPGFNLGVDSGKKGGIFPTIFNASNEEAVQAFLDNKISFSNIPVIIEKVLNLNCENSNINSIEDLLLCDEWARKKTKEIIA